MKQLTHCCALVLAVLLGSSEVMLAQQTSSNGAAAVMPRMIRFAGSLVTNESSGKVAGVTFSLYRDESGGAPLWIETQNATLDDQGRYEVLLGSTKPDGIPVDLFTSGEARWLGIRAEGGQELPRVLLVSVPYAVKALDAEMLGGKPPAAFALANSQDATTSSNRALPGATAPGSTTAPPPATITGSGTLNFIPRWTGAASIGNSVLFQSSGGRIGLGTTSPGAKLDVPYNINNVAAIRGTSNATSAGVGVEGVTGTTTSFPGNMVAVMGLNQSKFGTAGLFNTTSVNSQVLVGQFNGNQVFAVDPTGRVIGSNAFFSNPSSAAVTGILNVNNCGNVCNAGYLGSSAGVLGQGGLNSPAGWFISQLGGLILRGQNSANTDMFTVANNGFVHAGSLVVDGINNTNTNGVQAFAFGGGALGVYGEADSAGNIGVEGFSLNGTGVFGETTSGLSAEFAGSGGGHCNFDNAGNMGCTGTKSAVVPLRDGRQVALYAVEAPENWFEDFGSGQLRAGAATVVLDAEFAQTVNASVVYHVFVTPNGECRGVYVTGKTATSFEVRELNGGQSNVSFDYRVVARRKGYETLRMQDLTTREAASRASIARRLEPPQKSTHKNHP